MKWTGPTLHKQWLAAYQRISQKGGGSKGCIRTDLAESLNVSTIVTLAFGNKDCISTYPGVIVN